MIAHEKIIWRESKLSERKASHFQPQFIPSQLDYGAKTWILSSGSNLADILVVLLELIKQAQSWLS